MGSSNTNRRYVRLWLVLFCLSIAGCSLPKLKSSLITGAATSAVVGVTSVLPGGVIVPTVAGGLTAATASALSAEDQGEPYLSLLIPLSTKPRIISSLCSAN